MYVVGIPDVALAVIVSLYVNCVVSSLGNGLPRQNIVCTEEPVPPLDLVAFFFDLVTVVTFVIVGLPSTSAFCKLCDSACTAL